MKEANVTKLPKLKYACSEAIQTLCTRISLMGPSVKSIVFAGCRNSDDNFLPVVRAWQCMAGRGKKVVLVNADIRKAGLNEKYGIKFGGADPAGLTEYLAGAVSMQEIMYQTNIPNAYLIPGGIVQQDASTLLASSALGNLMECLTREFDYVFVLTAPMGMESDALQIADTCDGAILIVEYDRVHRDDLIRMKQQMTIPNCRLLGTVINHVDLKNFLVRKFYHKMLLG